MQKQTWQSKVDHYLCSGDPKALGLLYERVFPLLLRQAQGLGLDTAEAEDLVHETFLVAMERREDFRQGENFEAWLGGILRNKVRQLNTRKGRRYDPKRLRLPHPEPPEQQLQEKEWLQAFERTLAGLPSRDRRILELFLMDASKPRQIAKELGIRPGTLRVQLHRALTRLRRALLRSEKKRPSRGLSGLLAFLRLPLGRRARGGGVTPLPGIALLALPLAMLALFFPRLSPGDRPDREPRQVLGMGEAFTGPNAREPQSEKTRVPRGSPPFLPTPPRPTPSPLLEHELRLQLVFASTGQPAAGIGLRLLRDPSQDPLLGQERAVSDSSGTVLFRGLKFPWVRIQVDRGRGRLLSLAKDRRRTEFTILLEEGHTLRGRCLDREGRPLVGVGIWLSADNHHALQGQVVTRSGPDGRFVLRGLQRGHLFAGILKGYQPSRLRLFTHQVRETLVLTRGGGEVLGHVVDERGHPVVGAEVLLGQDQRTHLGGGGTRDLPAAPTRLVRTDHQGSFRIQGLPTGTQPLLVRARGKAPWARQLLVPPGGVASPLVRLGHGRQLQLRCLDPAGKPIANLPVIVHGTQPFQSAGGQTDPLGRLRLESLPTDPLRIQAIPEAFAPIAKALPPGEGRLKLVLHFQSLRLLRGVLKDERGTPLPHWRICNRSYFTGPGIEKTWRRSTDEEGRFEIPYATSKTLVLGLQAPDSNRAIRVGLRLQQNRKEYEVRIPDRLRLLPSPGKASEAPPLPREESLRCLLLLRLPKDHGLRHAAFASLVLETLGGGGSQRTRIQLLPGPVSRVPLRIRGKGPFRLRLRLKSGLGFEGGFQLPPSENCLEGIPIVLKRIPGK